MPKITIRLNLVSLSGPTLNIAPVLRGDWSPVSSSVTFTAASKTSRGGAGHLNDLFDGQRGRGAGSAYGVASISSGIDQPDTLALLELRQSITSSAAIPSTFNIAPVLRGDWSPVSSSVTFTSASKTSRGGAGHLNDLFDGGRAKGTDGQIGLATLNSGVYYISTTTITTTRNLSGTSRIQVTVTNNLTGTSRIQVTNTHDQTGVSSIIGSTQQNQLGVSSIQNTTDRTQTGTARIQVTSSHDQSGISRISVRQTRTQTGVANIYATTTKTLTGKSNIRNTTTRNQSGVSSISNTTTQTQSGTARITIVSSVTMDGRSAIQNTTTQTQTGSSRVTVERGSDQFGTARIQVTESPTQTGVSRIRVSVSRTQTGTSRIYNQVRQTLLGKSRIADATLVFAPLFDVREMEAPESIAGTMTFGGTDDARFEDWVCGRFNFQYAYGYPTPQNSLTRRDGKQAFTASDFLRTELFQESVDNEGDMTAASTTIDGDTARTTDWISGYFADRFATISNKTNAILTQDATEVLRNNDNADQPTHLTAACTEVLFQPASAVRDTQQVVEVLRQINVSWTQQEAIELLGIQISSLRYAAVQQLALEALQSIKARVRHTQSILEFLHGQNPDPPVNLTQSPLEVLRQKTEIDSTPTFLQQAAIEALKYSITAPVSINHMALEWAIQPPTPVLINHIALEWTRTQTNVPVRVNHAALEKTRNAASTPAQLNSFCVEVLVRAEYDPTVSSLINNPRVLY